MVKLRVVAAIVAVAMLMQVPAVALAGAQEAAGRVSGSPVISTSASPLSAAEMARYGQMQSEAQRTGVLENEKGGADATTWTIVGIVAVVCIGVGLGVAIANVK